MEVDHEAGQVFVEELRTVPEGGAARHLVPSEESIRARLGSPIVRTYLDTDKICFERNKSGLWGWRSDKVETVNGRDCKVFGATNVELVTKSRTEHLGGLSKNSFLTILSNEKLNRNFEHRGRQATAAGQPERLPVPTQLPPGRRSGGRARVGSPGGWRGRRPGESRHDGGIL